MALSVRSRILVAILAVLFQCTGFASAYNRCNFPKGFVFGTASAAYQYEGAVHEGGRKPSIWDTFVRIPGTIQDGTTGDVAEDQYHRYPEDIHIMNNLNMDAYRFSISWPRIFPDGEHLNPAGIEHYNELINALLKAGIKPYVTLYHWDLPQALQDNFGGWLSPKIIEKYAQFAEACFKAFGDRVKYWITFNEPLIFTTFGYALGGHAPGRCTGCKAGGNSGTEPYIVGHNVMLSHAAAVKIYRKKYQVKQGGKIGITLNANWYEPLTHSHADISASRRKLDFELGWFLDPVMTGDYPKSMRSIVGPRLPVFSAEQSESLKGSIDFLGLNHYTTNYAAAVPASSNGTGNNINDDPRATTLNSRNGVPIGQQSASPWLFIVPWGMNKLVTYISRKYHQLPIIITENGVSEANNQSIPLKAALQDDVRVNYYHGYLSELLKAIRKGAKVEGYFAWSLLDNFEWASGYTVRFGLIYVDFNNNNLARYPKRSALWFKRLLGHKCS